MYESVAAELPVAGLKRVERMSQIGTKAPRSDGLVKTATRIFESVGLLNKGSSTSAATPASGEAAVTAGINSNSLNVTRVGGLGALVAGVGASALAIYNVNKDEDPTAIVVAAYASVGAVIAAALLTVAIIISADIRSRASANLATSPMATAKASEPDQFAETWQNALAKLEGALDRTGNESGEPAARAWLDASASSSTTAKLTPSDDKANLHAQLVAGQSFVLSRLEKLIAEQGKDKRKAILASARSVLSSMRARLPG